MASTKTTLRVGGQLANGTVTDPFNPPPELVADSCKSKHKSWCFMNLTKTRICNFMEYVTIPLANRLKVTKTNRNF